MLVDVIAEILTIIPLIESRSAEPIAQRKEKPLLRL
jgi:hypothetical protein